VYGEPRQTCRSRNISQSSALPFFCSCIVLPGAGVGTRHRMSSRVAGLARLSTLRTRGLVALCSLGGEDVGQCPTGAVTGDSLWLVPPYKIVHCDLLLHVRHSVWSSVVILPYTANAAAKASGEGGRNTHSRFSYFARQQERGMQRTNPLLWVTF